MYDYEDKNIFTHNLHKSQNLGKQSIYICIQQLELFHIGRFTPKCKILSETFSFSKIFPTVGQCSNFLGTPSGLIPWEEEEFFNFKSFFFISVFLNKDFSIK